MNPAIEHPRWLLIQLARFGDLMQTSPLVQAAKSDSSQPEIHLLVSSGLEELARRIDGVRDVWALPRDRWLSLMEDTGISWVERSRRIAVEIETLNRSGFDRVINLTHTPESAYLSSMIDAKERRGLHGDRHGVLALDDWERYFQMILNFRDQSVFNLTDIHLGITGLPAVRSKGKLNIPQNMVDEYKLRLNVNGGGGPIRVAVQLGTSTKRRQWPVASFARAIEEIHKQVSIEVILVGSENDAELGEDFKRLTSAPVLSYIGNTSLVELAALLSCCDLMLSGDTGTLHLAAALSLPSVSTFLGVARAIATAPYLPGCLCFEPVMNCYPCNEDAPCEHFACHGAIMPDAVAQGALGIISDNRSPVTTGGTCRSLETRFDELGLLVIEPDVATDRDFKAGRMRELWRSRLNGGRSADYKLSDEVMPTVVRQSLDVLLETVGE